ncbi:hypothetical protein GGI04_001876 [Coemansia thaxteri]|nr:hypothetical protein GGI04_001876 [Coemansia thaxteri]KAJ2473227.1 hypothetical protein GGI02_001024 [Coemansia sp. RSA 2322]KAJ2473248.1 hypothetical protein EV174_005732 [Coemansia sp. RSA 2320]
MLSYTFLGSSGARSSEGAAPSPPVEQNPSTDDWGTTLVAIAVMSLIAFVALGFLIKKSFQLVPTGVMALRTLVSNRPSGYHRLDPNNPGDVDGVDEDDDFASGLGDSVDHRRLEILSDDDASSDGGDGSLREAENAVGGDAGVLHIRAVD